LTARSDRQQFHEHDTKFKAIADDVAVINKPFKSFGYQREAAEFVEPVISLWTLSEIRALAKGKSVVFTIGDRKVTLTDQQLQALRDVSSHFNDCLRSWEHR